MVTFVAMHQSAVYNILHKVTNKIMS